MTVRIARRATMLVLLCVLAGAVGAAPASARLSGFKQTFAPINAAIRADGTAIGNAVQGASKQSDAQLALTFARLAQRTANLTARVAKVPSPAQYTPAKLKLAQSLLAVSRDLLAIAKAAAAHSAPGAKTATTKLVTDSAKVKTARFALASKLGLP